MSVGSAIGGAEETVDLVAVLAILGVAIYLFYKFPDFWQSIKDDFSAVGSAVYHPSFPGGGEVAGTVETYPGALEETIEHPVDTLGVIFSGSGVGTNCFTCDDGQILSGTCTQIQKGQQVCTNEMTGVQQ
jgi:hypothetical protein